MAFFSFLFGITNQHIYSVMNDDYAELCDIVSQLRDAAKHHVSGDEDRDRKQRDCQDLVDTLLTNAQSHFKNEEGLMKNYAYPLTRQHSMDHLVLLRTIETIRLNLRMGKSIAPDHVTMLRDWLDRHIGGADNDLSAFLASYQDLRDIKRKDLSDLSRPSLSLAISVNDTVSQDVVGTNRSASSAYAARCEGWKHKQNSDRADRPTDTELRQMQDRIWYE